MTDYTWPDDLVPYAMSFYLQPHTGGSESPFSRVSKTYGLSAPRWICRMSFRGGDSAKRWGKSGAAVYGQRLDALLAKLKGRENRIEIYDFRRNRMTAALWPASASNDAATAGDSTMTITGLPVGTPIYNGDYIGGDGRPHIIADDDFGPVHTHAVTSGEAIVIFEPPLRADIAAGDAVFGNPTGMFKLTSDDAGANMAEVGALTGYELEFVEDLTATEEVS